MFKTIAKSAAVGSVLSFVRNVTGRRSQTHYLASLGLVAIGVVIGASAGLLFAPKSGSELREDMRVKAKQLQSKASERVRSSSRMVETNV